MRFSRSEHCFLNSRCCKPTRLDIYVHTSSEFLSKDLSHQHLTAYMKHTMCLFRVCGHGSAGYSNDTSRWILQHICRRDTLVLNAAPLHKVTFKHMCQVNRAHGIGTEENAYHHPHRKSLLILALQYEMNTSCVSHAFFHQCVVYNHCG